MSASTTTTAPGQEEANPNVQVLQQQVSPNINPPAPQQQAAPMQAEQSVGQPPVVVSSQQPVMVQQQQPQPRQITIQPMTMPAQQQQPTFVQQPVFVPQGQQSFAQPALAGMGSGGAVYYVAQPQPGISLQTRSPPDYEYKPNSFLVLSVATIIICGVFSPLSLACSIPGLIFSLKSERSYKLGEITMARKLGLIASYMIIATIVFALVTAIILTGAVIPSAAAYRCLASGTLTSSNPRYPYNYNPRPIPNSLGSCSGIY